MKLENKTIDFSSSMHNILVSAHDIGAANIIFSFIEKYSHHNYFFNLEGPAKKIYLKKNYKNYSLDNIPDSFDILISGTGWQSDHEHLARRYFYKKNLHVVAVIDHWVNYSERFIKEKEKIFANEIWVTDKIALAKAREELSFKNLKLIKNYYLDRIVKKIKSNVSYETDSILYLSEPIRSQLGKEFDYLNFFLKSIDSLKIGDRKIFFRLHPTEHEEKYKDYLSNSPKDIQIDKEQNVEDSIISSKYIFGIQSMALYTAALAGKTTYTVLMQDDDELVLPSKKIIELRKGINSNL
tara:strand:+ start:1010 stop:1897 length:888 start_codon:yes stop_codon:yes gene_type:complete